MSCEDEPAIKQLIHHSIWEIYSKCREIYDDFCSRCVQLKFDAGWNSCGSLDQGINESTQGEQCMNCAEKKSPWFWALYACILHWLLRHGLSRVTNHKLKCDFFSNKNYVLYLYIYQYICFWSIFHVYVVCEWGAEHSIRTRIFTLD